MLSNSRDNFHEGVCTLQFMEELVKLFQGQLSVYGLPLILFIQQIHLQMNKAFTIALYH